MRCAQAMYAPAENKGKSEAEPFHWDCAWTSGDVTLGAVLRALLFLQHYITA